MIDTRARGLDVSDNQDPAQMQYPAWRRLGFCFLFYQVARGLTPTAGAAQHRKLARQAGYLTGPYLYMRANTDPAAQARLLLASRGADDELPDMLDVEAAVTEAQLAAFCDEHDRSGVDLAIYTGYGVWERIAMTPAARARYGRYRLIVAGYPFDAPPDGAGRDVQPMDPAAVAARSTPPVHAWPLLPAPWPAWWSWQHTGHGTLPDYAGFLDLEVANMTQDELRARYPSQVVPAPAPVQAQPAVMVPRGSLVAIHAINPGNTLQLVKDAVAAGAPYAAVKMLNDAEALAQVKQASPTTWCYLRYLDPADDSLQGLDDWSEANEDAWCDRVIYKIYSQITAAQCLLIDWACAWNEEDPPGRWGYQKLGQTFIRLGNKNEARKAAGLAYVKLAFGTLAQGTPELWEMQQLYDTGLFQWMHDHFYSWDDHEGVFAWQPINQGYGDKLPSTPEIKALGPGHGDVPAIAGSGSACFRFVWLFERLLRPAGQLVPLLMGEWYPGKLGELDRYWWYDDRLSQFEYVTGFAGYNLGVTKDWPDLTPDYTAPAFRQHRIDTRNRINGGLMPNVSDADLAALVASNQADAVILAKYKAAAPAPLYLAAVLVGVIIRDTTGADTGRRLTVGSEVAVYAEHVTAGGYTERVRINANGDNVTTVDNTGRPTLQRQ